MINKKIENDVESEKSIIAHSHLYDINPLDKDGNFIGLLKLKQRISNKKNALKHKMGLFKN